MEGRDTLDPIEEIIQTRQEARLRNDPHVDVCFFVTATLEGRPAARAISLRDIDAKGFGLLLNKTSPKWKQLTAHGYCSLLILWSTVRRQYRIQGRIDPMEPERLQHYWARKSHGSKLLEHYYQTFHPQSHPIASHAHLLQGIEELKKRYPQKETVPIPDTLQGIYLYPTEIEIWHGSPEDRLHHRRLFTRIDTCWSFCTLVP
jgi:pyridoxamine 5'-phosphate oxidase